jgi:stage V sporulation protein SpoVS
MVAPALVDNLEAQGLFKGTTRATPSLVPEMFIGREGISNLGEAGMIDAPVATNLLENAQRDWFKLPADEWDKLYGKEAIAFDPVANKAMLEISDKNVDLRKGVDLNKIPENEILAFDEVFKADVLKKAYPDIEDVTVSFIDDSVSPRLAAYAPEQNMILFNRQHPDWRQADTPVKVALHEIQHYVQGKELFTRGESFTGVLNQNDSYNQATSSLTKAITQSPAESLRFGKTEKLGFNPDNVAEAIAALSKPDGLSARKSLEQSFKDKQMVDKFIAKASNYPTISTALQAKDQASQGYNKSVADYMKVAGEVFARQTEQRRGMSATERAANPAMRAIETDPQNMMAGVTIDNMTAPRAEGQQASMGEFTINPGKTQRSNTTPTYEKAFDLLNVGEGDTVLDYGAGMGLGSSSARKRGANVVTFEPIPPKDFTPDFTNAADIPEAVANKAVNMNVLNVLPPAQRNEAVTSIGRSLMPNGEAIINVRGAAEVNSAKNKIKSEDGYIIGSGKERTFQKGFTQKELKSYVAETLGDGYVVESVPGLSGATVRIKKLESAAPVQFTDPFAMQVPQSTIPEGM